MRGRSSKSLDEFMVETYKILMREWGKVAKAIEEKAKEIEPRARVYVIGSVARGTATALSDLDVLVVIPKDVDKAAFKRALRKMAANAIPDYFPPVNLHVVHDVHEGEEGKYFGEQKIGGY